MKKIQIVLERIIVNQELIEESGDTPQGGRIDTPAELLSGLEHVQVVLAGLKIEQVGLKDRLNSLFRAVLPRSDREASIWRVFSIEYGPDAPITRAFDSKANPNQLQNFVDHYQRRG